VLRTNLTGAFLCTAAVIEGMRRRGWGRIVSVASGSALRPTAGTAAYAASKAGLIAMTKAVALEAAAEGVTANVVAPGIVDTPMARAAWPTDAEMLAMATASPLANPMACLLAPEDIAAAIAWLATDDARRLTGQTLHVNGGSLMP
jgi:2-hydroxycyclohexanecarboxyl-CoA dehydrogenase